MYRFGRLLQLAGLTILPLSVFLQLGDRLDLRQSLVLSAFGVIAFYLGYMLQGVKPA